MKKSYLILLIGMTLLAGCKKQNADIESPEDKPVLPEPEPIEIKFISKTVEHHPKDTTLDMTTFYHYDEQDRLIKMEIIDNSGEKLIYHLKYTGNEVSYTADMGFMQIKARYETDENGRVTLARETQSMMGMNQTGINTFEYDEQGRLKSIGVSTQDSEGVTSKPMNILVGWEGNSLMKMDSEEGSESEVHIQKEYDLDTRCNTNLDLNFLMERFFQTGTFLVYEPFISGNCGQHTDYMLSKYSHDLRFSMSQRISMTFIYDKSEDGTIHGIQILNRDGSVNAQVELSYR